MSLIVACPNCQTRYNLPPQFEGKKVKCKSCGKPFSASVGAARVQAGAQKQAATKVQTDPDELAKMGIGTIRQAPDPFAAPAHAGPDPLRNHVVQDPGFGMPSTEPTTPGHAAPHSESADDGGIGDVVANPYIQSLPKPGIAGRPPKKGRRGKIEPTAVGVGEVFKFAWDTWSSNLGLLLGITFFTLFVSIALGAVQAFLPLILTKMGAEGFLVFVSPVLAIFVNGIQIFLTLGQTIIILKLLRGRQTGFSELFSGGPVFSQLVVGLIIFGIGIFLGTLLFVLPGILLALFFWPYYHLIADEKAKALESFGVAKSFASMNIGTTFVLALASFGIYFLGLLAVFVGIFFAAPLVSTIWCAAYLMMSGQIQPQR